MIAAIPSKRLASIATRADAKRSAPQQSEGALQRSIVDFVRLVCPQLLVFAIPNASHRTIGGFAGNGVAGLYPGIHDLCLLAPLGRVYFVEVKVAGGVLSAVQSAVHIKMTTMGVPHCVARSIEDVRVALRNWNIETREAT